ncbi:hypothetical protein COY17_01910 [Candidatus Saccharibacteria bacterium CG_4_10_14_0_2_um_filter_52_9]|nr:MAG: hypothetical protein COY17_01910 [Candidatus Saccharibacteria bacterium CG_4_10_14_0_2_um_filter_52_9]
MHTYSVTNNQQLTPTTLLVTLKNTEPSRPFDFQPGQYAAISFFRRRRPTAARCFSIVSSPTNPDILQFSMRTKGRFTRALAGAQPGDVVKVRGPFGGFVFDPASEPEVVLLAGGIGITPFMSMIRYAAATRLANRVTLLFSCASQDDVPFGDELRELERQNSNFRAVFVISQEPVDKLAGERVASGRINADIIAKASAGLVRRPTYFICGPQPFMRAMNKLLHAQGVDGHRVMTEAFSQGPNHQTGKIRSWPFNIYFLGAASLAIGSFVVMVADLLKTLPATSASATNNVTASSLTNSRQADLDSLVNSLPETANTAPSSAAAVATASQPTTTTVSTSTAPKPTPVAAPRCTTTASGVTTCN